MFVQRPGPILGSGLSAGPSPRSAPAAWRCSNRRATGVESLAELQPTHRQLAVFASQVLVLRSGVSARFQRLFSSWQAPRASVGHVVPARGIVEKGDADDHEGSLGCRPSQPVPLVDRVRIVLAADARPPMLKRG